VTEVPEHLLKKAAEARARLTGEGGGDAGASDDAPTAAPASTTPVPAAAALPAEPEPEPEPVPDTPWAAAAKARKTIPVWVMPVLLFLPIWAIYYVGYLERPPAEGGLAVEGEEIYAQCAGCHGGGGGGGTGRQLNEGQVLLTFPYGVTGSGYDGLAGMIAWVAKGSTGVADIDGGPNYGDPDRPGGAQVIGGEGVMAGFAAGLNVEELGAVVFHERAQFGDMEPDAVIEELELIEEWIEVMEEEGIDIVGIPYDTVHETLETARGNLGMAES
jgi:mono/diheme cytochrome c family protein